MLEGESGVAEGGGIFVERAFRRTDKTSETLFTCCKHSSDVRKAGIGKAGEDSDNLKWRIWW
jgi:hypothetical protein